MKIYERQKALSLASKRNKKGIFFNLLDVTFFSLRAKTELFFS